MRRSRQRVEPLQNGSAPPATTTLYKNGTPVASGTASGPVYENRTDPFAVGVCGAYIGTTGGNEMTHLDGYLDELRITRGTALYTAAFKPARAPLPDPLLHVVAP